MNPKWFPNKKNPVTGTQGFTTMKDSKYDETIRIPSDSGEYKKYVNNKKNRIDYSIMPNDVYIKLYYTSIGLLLLYIFMKTFRERK
jgi:hypothetical protein